MPKPFNFRPPPVDSQSFEKESHKYRSNKVLSEDLRDPYLQDFHYILTLLRNPLSTEHRNQIQLLISQTMFFASGRPQLYVCTAIRGSEKGKLCWFKNNYYKFEVARLFKLFFDEFKIAVVKQPGQYIYKTRILQDLVFKKQQNPPPFVDKLLGDYPELKPEDITLQSHFMVAVKRLKSPKLEKRPYYEQENKIEYVPFQTFVKIAQKTPISPYWQKITYFQKVNRPFGTPPSPFTFKFEIEKIDNLEMFERAGFEAQSISGICPNHCNEFISSSAERIFMTELLAQSKSEYIKYVSYKVHKTAYFFSKVSLKKFLAIFNEDSFGNIYLSDIRIFDVSSIYKDLYSSYSMESDKFKEFFEQKSIQHNILEVEKQLDSRHTEIDERSAQFKDRMEVQFKEIVLEDLGKPRQKHEKGYDEIMNGIDEVFDKLHPESGFLLSKKLRLSDKPFAKFRERFKTGILNIDLKDRVKLGSGEYRVHSSSFQDSRIQKEKRYSASRTRPSSALAPSSQSKNPRSFSFLSSSNQFFVHSSLQLSIPEKSVRPCSEYKIRREARFSAFGVAKKRSTLAAPFQSTSYNLSSILRSKNKKC